MGTGSGRTEDRGGQRNAVLRGRDPFHPGFSCPLVPNSGEQGLFSPLGPRVRVKGLAQGHSWGQWQSQERTWGS